MRKLFVCLMVLTVLLMGFAAFAESTAVTIDETNTVKGVVGISYLSTSTNKIKVLISKGDVKYYYDLKPDGVVESFPLQLGDGEYKIGVLENIGGTKYAYLKSATITVKLESPNVVYLNSVQNIKWTMDYNAIKKNIALIGKETDIKKRISLAYNFIIKNISYDFDKIPTLKPDYNPNVEITIKELKGICYDYSSLFAAMKRSEGIPVKMIKGYSKNVNGYHAWNEILIDGKWIVVDSTSDAAYLKGKVKFEMAKNPADYTKVYEY